jgi:hypothetical protein
MNTLPTLSLDENWRCAYFEDKHNAWSPGSVHVHSLSEWLSATRASGIAAVLFHQFDLEPTDFCVNYMLHVESAPGTIRLEINGRRMGEFDGSPAFAFDVTDYVALEDNTISFQVDCSAAGKFGAVYLEQVPCE